MRTPSGGKMRAAPRSPGVAQAQPAGSPVPVTVENFRRAESDMDFASTVQRALAVERGGA